MRRGSGSRLGLAGLARAWAQGAPAAPLGAQGKLPSCLEGCSMCSRWRLLPWRPSFHLVGILGDTRCVPVALTECREHSLTCRCSGVWLTGVVGGTLPLGWAAGGLAPGGM